MKVEKSSADLESEIIFRGLCAHCGTCGAFCPHIEYYEEGDDAGLPKVLDSCIENVGVCYNSCPRADFNVSDLEKAMYGKIREDEVLGVYLDTILVKSKSNIINALLETAFKHGMIDSTIVPEKKSKKPVNNVPTIISDASKLPELSSRNLDYTGPLVTGVNKACEAGYKAVALVGNPCHQQGAAKIKYSNFKTRIDALKLQIAVMCSAGGAKGCIYCVDYAGEFADISYSEMGQEKGQAALIIRTETGKKLVDLALKDKAIKKVSDEPNLEKVKTLGAKKKKRNIKNILKINLGKIGYLDLTDKELGYFFS